MASNLAYAGGLNPKASCMLGEPSTDLQHQPIERMVILGRTARLPVSAPGVFCLG